MAWEGSTRSARLPANWPTIRRRILRRDRGICHVCGRPGADQVDHIQAGDNHDPSNLAAIHDTPCHRAKSAHEGGAAGGVSSGRTRRAQAAARRREPEPHPGLRSSTP